ncbi:DUF6134 family protein [uncultured Maricaulis sp.]|uniref:DUF6134 family protein n=1 Tax=uncultured Maricaulis sp. TaxID=174710 RepID=UPI00261FC157|nr:DUF6134 family protein [uncultured Maricaulis sp.]
MTRYIQMFQTTLLALAALGIAAVPASAELPEDVTFDVFRNGSPFGEHRVEFSERADGRMEVEIEIGLRVGFGPVTVFRYEHESKEVWEDGELVSLAAMTLKDGDRTRYALERDDEGRLVSDAGRVGDLVPSSHWSGYAAGLPAVLNTETGEPMAVTIEDMGMDRIETVSGMIDARRFRMTGTVTVDLWYDAGGRWVGCAFSIRDQDIVYRLRDA